MGQPRRRLGVAFAILAVLAGAPAIDAADEGYVVGMKFHKNYTHASCILGCQMGYVQNQSLAGAKRKLETDLQLRCNRRRQHHRCQLRVDLEADPGLLRTGCGGGWQLDCGLGAHRGYP